MVICLERGADLHMAQLMPLLLSKIQIGLPFWYRLTRVVPEKGHVCVFLLLDVVCRILYENSGQTQHWMMANGF